MKKRGFLVAILFIIVFLLPLVKSNFVCGSVETLEDISPAWLPVTIYYSENPSVSTNCQVSPQEKKFCCDPLDIRGINWAIGKSIEAKINYDGYYAAPVSLMISGEGYDVFPPLELYNAIWTNLSEMSTIINETNRTIGISLLSQSPQVSYKLSNSRGSFQSEICENCQDAQIPLSNLAQGRNELEIISSHQGEKISKKINLNIIDSVKIERKISCKKCGSLTAYSDTIVDVTLTAEFSQPISGEISEFFPNDWILVDEKNMEESTQTHNKISWSFEGTSFEKKYQIKSPKTFLSKNAKFFSEIDGEKINEGNILLFRYYKFLPLSSTFSSRPNENDLTEKYLLTSPSNPLVMDIVDNEIFQIAVFPDQHYSNKKIYSNFNYPLQQNQVKLFSIGTDLPEVESVMIKYRLKKSNSEGNLKSSRLIFQEHLSGEWAEIPSTEEVSDEEYVNFIATHTTTGLFSLEAEYE